MAITLKASHFDLSSVVSRLRRNSLTVRPGYDLLGRFARVRFFIQSYAFGMDDIAYQRWE